MSRTETLDGPGDEVQAMSARNEMHAGYAGNVVQVAQAGVINIYSGLGKITPWRVPRALRTFENQVLLLQWLVSMIPALVDPVSLIIVHGPPGIGKTEVVRQFAHLNRGRFSGGQFHIDCSGLTATDGTGEVLGKLLRSIGIKDQHLPADREDRQGLFLTMTASKPVLIVLEDATEAPHVRAALPNSEGSMVLVTAAGDLSSLSELVADGAQFRAVDRFSQASSIRLLARICGPERVAAESMAADALARLCGGMPDTICRAGMLLVRNSGWTIAQVARELSPASTATPAPEPDGELLIVSRTYDALYDSLPEPAQRVYLLLGWLPLPDVSTAAVAVAAGHDTANAATLLDDLRSAGLLETRPDGRHELRELAREHASRLAAEAAGAAGAAQADDPDQAGEQDRALHALVRWFVIRAAYADRAVIGRERARAGSHEHLLAGHQDPFAAADDSERKKLADAWLDSERASMVPLVRAAAEHGWHDETWQLAEALTGAYYYNHRHLADWLAVSRLGIRAAQRCGNDQAEARLLLSASRAHADHGDADLARDAVEAAMVIAERGTNAVLLASAHEFRGRYLEGSDPQRALAEYALSRELNLGADEQRGAALAGFFAARLRAGSPDAAPEELERALRDLRESAGTFRSLDDSRMAGRALIAAGAVEDRLGHGRDATATLEEAVRALGNAHYAAEALEMLAGIAERSGDPAAARQRLQDALRIYEAAGHPGARDILGRLSAER